MAQGRMEMKVAMTTLIVIAAMSTSSYAQFYNAAAALGACQEDALQGVHYPINGDCPNWEAWKASHTQAQTLPRRHAYPASRRRRRGPDAVEDMRGQSAVISSDQSNSFPARRWSSSTATSKQAKSYVSNQNGRPYPYYSVPRAAAAIKKGIR